jgi:hypothetical protein
MAYKGKFKPNNPKKYRGDPTNIIYRSLWELRVMRYFDESDKVLEWSSEEIAVPYRDPSMRDESGLPKRRRYYPDFIIRARKANGSIATMMIEVKPKQQTMEPKVQSKKTKRYITEVTTWATNSAKWKAAEEYCLDRGWEFKIITEAEIYCNTKKNQK